ncbi:hypothetical protein B0H17DRAFT_1177084 [Mycena rosella]|uniref:Uncharacterized protein n=1 Tax=Mycena rosella TaxID=1033263 RepID=A0AAD7DW46_MYCRO|nr:hypothetical protein B0H17DRAFT_1177084 [Mycena rosella]
MADNFCQSLLSVGAILVPNGLVRNGIIASVFIVTVFLLRYARPTLMAESVDKSLRDTENLFYETCDIHNFNAPSLTPVDNDVAARLIVLQDKAAKLRVQTLRHGTSLIWLWNELLALCNGRSFAIWRCARHIGALQNDIKVIKLERLRELNIDLALCASSGASPLLQLSMRHRHHCGIGSSAAVPAVHASAC